MQTGQKGRLKAFQPEKSMGGQFHLHQTVSRTSQFSLGGDTILFSSCGQAPSPPSQALPESQTLHPAPVPPHPPPKPSLVHCISLHTFGRCIHYFVSLFTYLPSLVPYFLLTVWAAQLMPYFQAVVPPLAKGLCSKDRLCHQKLCSQVQK